MLLSNGSAINKKKTPVSRAKCSRDEGKYQPGAVCGTVTGVV